MFTIEFTILIIQTPICTLGCDFKFYDTMIYKHLAILLLPVMLQLAPPAQQTHQLDTKQSKILWNTGKMMGGHYGYLHFNFGSLVYSRGGEPLSGFFSIDMKSIRSTDHALPADNQKTDAQLRTEDFLAVDRYSAATINIRKITRIGTSPTFNVAGDLSIKGITKPIEFTATIHTKDNTTTITANIDIHRQMWNIHSKPATNLDFLSGIPAKVVADEVHISLDLKLNR